jgi:DNA repair protein RadA/Sms
MAKVKTVFYCKECGNESSKWTGQCPACKEWNTLVEAPKTKGRVPVSHGLSTFQRPSPKLLSEVETMDEERIRTNIQEFDRVLGGGIVVGSLVLVGGDPGIGKSTLLLQMCQKLASDKYKVLYISGEESQRQIKMRGDRLGKLDGDLKVLCEMNLDVIVDVITQENPDVVIVDSIQTMFKEEVGTAPGSVSQVRETTMTLMQLAKSTGISIFIVGHVTKEGTVAGPKLLEHMVDTVLYIEGDKSATYRILRGVKNRFGSTNEVGVFEMQEKGLVEVSNPSEYMLAGRPLSEPGSVVTASIEGTRPILVEVQALVAGTNFNLPRRTAAGTDFNRVNLLMAVLEKRLGLVMADKDAYVNVAGGMRINEPALDLAIVVAIMSSYKNRALDNKTLVFGEIGLTGEIRAVNLAEQRVSEAEKMGFTSCILPKGNINNIKKANSSKKLNIELIGISNIHELNKLI